MKKVTRVFDGREALPVRAIPLVTAWYVTPQDLTLELSEDKSLRSLTAYRYSDGQAIPIKADAWGMKNDELNDIAQAYKRNELEADQHRQLAWRKSLEGLPADVFVWLDEFEDWYCHAYVSADSDWEEQHRVVSEDDDPEPQFHPKRHDALDLFPISLDDFEPLISEGFETEAIPALSAPVLTEAVEAIGALGGDTQSIERIRYAVLASRTELIEAFSCYGVELNIFKALNDRPVLKAARRIKGQGQRGSRAEPMFCPFEVMNWLVKKGVKGKPKLTSFQGWHILETKFPSVYIEKSVGDPRQN